MTPLRQRMIEDMQIRNMAKQTQTRYVEAVATFVRFHGKSPELLGKEEIRAYQVNMLERKLSSSTLRMTVCALRFLYSVTLGRKEMIECIPHPKRPKTLPVVLSREEVAQFLDSIYNRKYR